MTIRPKNRVLINWLFSFVQDHSTKLWVILTLLFILFIDVPIFRLLYSWQILPLYIHRFVSGSKVCYIHSSTTYIVRTLYSLESCFYILYTISMAIWSLSLFADVPLRSPFRRDIGMAKLKYSGAGVPKFLQKLCSGVIFHFSCWMAFVFQFPYSGTSFICFVLAVGSKEVSYNFTTYSSKSSSLCLLYAR